MTAEAFAHDAAANVDGLTYRPDEAGGNVFVLDMPSGPDVAVLVRAPIVPIPDKLPHARVALQLIVRGARRDSSGHQDLCQALRDHFDCHPQGDIGAGAHTVHLVGCTHTSEAPLGLDDNGRPETSLNFTALIHHPTPNRS